MWSLLLVVVPYVLLDALSSRFLPKLSAIAAVGIVLFILFSMLGLTSAFFMVRDGEGTPLPLDQTNKLVVSGPYRYVRNPMAVAGIGQGFSVGLIFHSVPILIYSILGAIFWHYAVRPVEDRDLTERFGVEYSEYRRKVTCWIPRSGRSY